MNDNSYAYEIQSKLISAVEIIFAHFISAEKELSLSDEDLDKLMVSRREEILDRLRQEEAQIDAIAGRENRDGNLDQSV
jgi:hypothetical protein